MNSYSLPSILQVLLFLSDSIFLGSKFWVPAIFLINIFNTRLPHLNLSCLTISANVLLLTGGVLFLAAMAINTGKAWYSGNESERDFVIILVTGSHGFQFVIPIINYALLPNLMWFKNLRKSIHASFVLVICWHLSFFLIKFLSGRSEQPYVNHASHAEFPWAEYSGKAAAFVILLTLSYIFVLKQNKSNDHHAMQNKT